MTSTWIKAKTEVDADISSQNFWKRQRKDLESGQFWADRIKSFRGEPVERLRLALNNLPLPAAFREAAVATRALIREQRKQNESYADQLALLYWLAAISSFSLPYSEKLKEPGYNVLESIPGEALKALPFSYSELGYEQLELLNKTDVKWLLENWGKPASHTTLHSLHRAVWDEYEAKLLHKRLERNSAFVAEMRSHLSSDSSLSRTDSTIAIKSQHYESEEGLTVGRALKIAVLVGLVLFFWLLLG